MKRDIVLFIIGIVAVFLCFVFYQSYKTISKTEAEKIARNTDAVKSFYAVKGVGEECIRSQVLLPCETDWVTCVEEAWVVRFEVKEECNIKHDGRLAVTLLVDGLDGKVRSRFPEKEYFNDSQYCMGNFDCVESEESGQCYNFVHGQIKGSILEQPKCECVSSQCSKL